MAFQPDLDAAIASGDPFRVEHAIDGDSTVVYLTPQEITHNQQGRASMVQSQQGRAAAKTARIARLDAADTHAKLVQWIKDEML